MVPIINDKRIVLDSLEKILKISDLTESDRNLITDLQRDWLDV